MNPITFALRRPYTVIVAILAVSLSCGLALRPKTLDAWLARIGVEVPVPRMAVDIFPSLNLPVIYVCQPYGGSVRSIVVRAQPDRLRAYGLSPDDVVLALSAGNIISPSGNLHLGDRYPLVPTNALIKNLQDFGSIPLRAGPGGRFICATSARSRTART